MLPITIVVMAFWSLSVSAENHVSKEYKETIGQYI